MSINHLTLGDGVFAVSSRRAEHPQGIPPNVALPQRDEHIAKKHAAPPQPEIVNPPYARFRCRISCAQQVDLSPFCVLVK